MLNVIFDEYNPFFFIELPPDKDEFEPESEDEDGESNNHTVRTMDLFIDTSRSFALGLLKYDSSSGYQDSSMAQ